MKRTTNNLVSSANVYPENRYAEFTTLFRIKFQSAEPGDYQCAEIWKYVFAAWWDVCARALEARMDSCVSMLFRNKDNILISNECQVVFRKSNGQIHAFNHPSFRAMERMVKYFQGGNWEAIKCEEQGVRQLLKALYWIPEDMRKDHGGFGFGQLISCLEEFSLIECNNRTTDQF
jgi:hypothetical protein